MSRIDLAVIGGGLFGQIVAAHARRQGASVVVIDENRDGAGSFAAGCVMRPSWMTRMSRQQIDAAFSLLDELYGLRQIQFIVKPLGKTIDCYRVEPSVVLSAPTLTQRVINVTSIEGTVEMFGATLEARSVVVAAGIWTRELCPWVPELSGKWGWSHRSVPVRQPIIVPWAPYRQIVAFNMDDGRSWIGDGSALLHKSVNDDNEKKSRDRCLNVVRAQRYETLTTLGARPYCDTGGEPCHVSRRGRVWAVTGGAKNGTAAAAWAARRVVEEALG